jgi:hypothetical protein
VKARPEVAGNFVYLTMGWLRDNKSSKPGKFPFVSQIYLCLDEGPSMDLENIVDTS